MTVGDVGVNRPIGDGVIEIVRKIPFTSGFLAVTNISIAFCKLNPRVDDVYWND
jgi:hypothetical protein